MEHNYTNVENSVNDSKHSVHTEQEYSPEIDVSQSLADKDSSLDRPLSLSSVASHSVETLTLEKPETLEQEIATLDDDNNSVKTPPPPELSSNHLLDSHIVTLDECDHNSLLDEIVFSPLAIPPLDEITFHSTFSLDEVDFSPPASPKFSPRRLLHSTVPDPKRRKSLFFAKPEDLSILRSKHRSAEIMHVDNKAFQSLVRQSSKLKTKGKDFTKKIRKTFSFHQQE
ncbi:hypothetical protein G6F56_003951 [Rhizopus delemar]|nr:hypothetical protein G6F56_003951 [Rhizopus delemar]